ncbi:hypothetical protein [Granulicella mallensis]|uniref:Uncharacterized protein n=1 Tax=Granulicella mallensis (strain ATCC BAA-1857 / DSM 23137 / MP5ACTX8) TaxID=682795 RepID=G8NQF5_GRAMM|nr:hypothetical protein [Granulicella mallensis]AEU36104.1 hypothetical protein AciX8_1766 [Granulicella mallensis MP5ACTX8]
MQQSAEKSIWIGMAAVKPRPGSETLSGSVSGAFVNVLTWASDSFEFREKAKELMDYLALDLIGVEDEEPLSERQKTGDMEPDITQIALEMKDNLRSIRYTTFHTWTETNA